MSEMSGRVVVIGDVMTDIIVRPEGALVRGSDRRAIIRSRPGGSGANQAVWLGALGVPVTLLARVGAEDVGALETHFRRLGVDPLLLADRDRPSGVLVTIVDPDGERSFFTDRGANLAFARADLPETVLDGVGVVMISGYSLFAGKTREAAMELIRRARSRGLAVAVDPASAGFLEEVGRESFFRWTAGCTLLLANADEAMTLTGSIDPAEQMQSLGMHYPTVVIKRGAGGAAVGGAEGIVVERPALPADVIDTTGAGDAFAAGYIAAMLRTEPLAFCLEAGLAAAARAVQHIGGQPEEPPERR